jgi:hypothetical protein
MAKMKFVVFKQDVSDMVLKDFGPGPFSKEEKQKIRKIMKRKVIKRQRAKQKYRLEKIVFDQDVISLRIPGFYQYDRMVLSPNQFISFFSANEIRRAVKKYLLFRDKVYFKPIFKI